ncbi:MAG: HAD-IIB family hydrolase, partial [Nitrospiria bacterium]
MMRFVALACDYDGTLASGGRLAEPTAAALERLVASGRKAILVTGRELDELRVVCPRLDLFERVVAENGALLYRPATREIVPLGEPPPAGFLDALRARGVDPLGVGRVIVATRTPHEGTVLQVIREWGLEFQVIFNKGAVMVLPAGINKATGLKVALDELGLSPHNVVGIGDAENDHAFLSLCECGVAVGDALPMLAERADFRTTGFAAEGAIELIDEVLATDLSGRDEALRRHHVLLGVDDRGREVRLSPARHNILIAGQSGAGKSTLATGWLERVAEAGYQVCIIDPEGDYEAFAPAVALGTAEGPPSVEEVLQVLEHPSGHVSVNLIGLPLAERPAFFAALFPRLHALRMRVGRPHWIAIDEVHHLLPSPWEPAMLALPAELAGLVGITLYPREVAPPFLAAIDTVITVGESAAQTMGEFFASRNERGPEGDLPTPAPGDALLWMSNDHDEAFAPVRVRIEPSQTTRRRHLRKYAEGELGPDRSFYFEGPEGKLRLRAQNLVWFVQLAQGVDDETWMHHLRRGDYSRWFREAIKDEALADEAG